MTRPWGRLVLSSKVERGPCWRNEAKYCLSLSPYALHSSKEPERTSVWAVGCFFFLLRDGAPRVVGGSLAPGLL